MGVSRARNPSNILGWSDNPHDEVVLIAGVSPPVPVVRAQVEVPVRPLGYVPYPAKSALVDGGCGLDPGVVGGDGHHPEVFSRRVAMKSLFLHWMYLAPS